MSESNIAFRPIKGLEQNILATDYHEGWLYFATDTKKIYLDANGEEKLPMGGNSGIYYGQMELEETPDEGLTEFTFNLFEIEGNEDPTRFNIPNIDDLILNIPDGCFYRVMLVDGESLDTVLTTEKLTIAGSGSGGTGGGGGSTEVGIFTLDRITPQMLTILFDTNYSIGFNATATDSSGEVTGNGTYELYVGGVKKLSGTAYQGDNYIPVGEYLALGENKIRLVVYMDVGGSSMSSKSKNYTITTTEMKLVWNYDETKINFIDLNFIFEWSVSGTGIKKTTNILIDDLYEITLSKDVTTTNSLTYTLTSTDLLSYNLIHGAHKIRMQVSADLNGNIVTTNIIYKNIMFVDRNNSSPVISCGLFTNLLVQYNTTFIPIIIYSSENISNNATVILQENGIEIDKWENIANQVVNQWSYTPTLAGTQVLTIQCGTSEVTLVVLVSALDIDNDEVPGYIFKFKASDFASNTAVLNWKQGDINLTFSEKFDWINGGLKSEDDDKGNNRLFVNIKAGSTMTINYPLFKINAKNKGKNLKIIFKATNCRDYDAEVLKCKRDTKIISINTENEIF